MKENFICCIVDFGFFVKYLLRIDEVEVGKLDIRIGIKRYMVFEILVNILDFRYFVVFKMVDVYLFGLVLWEIIIRCKFDGMCFIFCGFVKFIV